VLLISFRGEEDDSLAIKPPQQMSRKEKAHHRKDEKRKEKRRHRSHSAEGGMEGLAFSVVVTAVCILSHVLLSSVGSKSEHEWNFSQKHKLIVDFLE
jgi:hypothetical protein